MTNPVGAVRRRQAPKSFHAALSRLRAPQGAPQAPLTGASTVKRIKALPSNTRPHQTHPVCPNRDAQPPCRDDHGDQRGDEGQEPERARRNEHPGKQRPLIRYRRQEPVTIRRRAPPGALDPHMHPDPPNALAVWQDTPSRKPPNASSIAPPSNTMSTQRSNVGGRCQRVYPNDSNDSKCRQR